MSKRPLKQAMDELQRNLERMGEQVRDAARTVAASSDDAGGPHNVATAVNVGRGGQVRGVSVKQRTRVRPDGTRVVETVRRTIGDGNGA